MEESSPETEVPSEKIEAETVEGPQPNEYEPGTGNSMLDALYSDHEEKPQEPESEPEPDTLQNVTIEQALFKAAESEADVEEKVEEKVEENRKPPANTPERANPLKKVGMKK